MTAVAGAGVPAGSSAQPPGSPFDESSVLSAVRRFRTPVRIASGRARQLGALLPGDEVPEGVTVVGHAPPVSPERLGDPAFCEAHGTRLPYLVGAMANLLTGEEMVVAAGRAGFLAFLGSAGVELDRLARSLDAIEHGLHADRPWGCNLIHTPSEPAREMALVDLLLRRQVRRLCASAFTDVTPAVVRYAASGLKRDEHGRVARRNHVFAKLSRPEVAAAFCRPAPSPILEELVRCGHLAASEADAAARVPLAAEITVEGDSGGHTDHQNTLAIFPVIALQALRVARDHGHAAAVRVGAAGGLGTPAAVAAAFAAGAAYVLTGSVNQAARESTLSAHGKRLLAAATPHDVASAPSADMFEAGARVQVLKRGTLFAGRARRLHEVYVQHESLESLPPALRARLEREVLGASIEEIWSATRAFFAGRDPRQLERAEADPRHRMALVFRWYLGMASRWAIHGDPARAMDYQIWCGPALGAFNAWVEGSFLAPLENRTVEEIGLNLLEGAATLTRAHQLRTFGLRVPASAFEVRPRPLASRSGEDAPPGAVAP